MTQTIKCPKCEQDAVATGEVKCWCDKDNCFGQRCAADNLSAHFKCDHCGAEGTPPQTMKYYEIHSK